MLIIVEGFDNSGKTSLVNHITKHNPQGPSIVFHSRPGIDQGARLGELLAWVRTYPSSLVITDRIGIIGEEVYGRNLRGYSEFSREMFDVWTSFFYGIPNGVKVVFIWCHPRNHEMGNKPEMEGVVENRAFLLDKYDETMVKTRRIFEKKKFEGRNVAFVEFDYQQDPFYRNISRLFGGEGDLK